MSRRGGPAGVGVGAGKASVRVTPAKSRRDAAPGSPLLMFRATSDAGVRGSRRALRVAGMTRLAQRRPGWLSAPNAISPLTPPPILSYDVSMDTLLPEHRRVASAARVARVPLRGAHARYTPRRGRDGLIPWRPIYDAESISQNTETHEEKTLFAPRDNQSLGTKTRGQSEIR